MNKLTDKEKNFAELVAGGKSYAQAFREAYDCSRSKPSTIRTDASRSWKENLTARRTFETRFGITLLRGRPGLPIR